MKNTQSQKAATATAIDLFLTFAKVGLFTFGGGYAMIALIENTCVEKKAWITHDEMMDVTVIAESTPGTLGTLGTKGKYRQNPKEQEES